jgi:hypothetical protein
MAHAGGQTTLASQAPNSPYVNFVFGLEQVDDLFRLHFALEAEPEATQALPSREHYGRIRMPASLSFPLIVQLTMGKKRHRYKQCFPHKDAVSKLARFSKVCKKYLGDPRTQQVIEIVKMPSTS